MTLPTRVIYMGTAAIGTPAFESLVRADDFEVVGVVTQPDRPRGRGRRPAPPPVKETALRLGVSPILQPVRVREPAVVDQLRALRPEVIVVIAFGQILPREVLEIPPLGCVNVHMSLLPRHRGAAPVAWALLSEDGETGVTTMLMDEHLDTGDILEQVRTPIEPGDDALTLSDRLAEMTPALLLHTLRGIREGTIVPRPQDPSLATSAPKLSKNDGAIDWAEPARRIVARVRAMAGWPGAFARLPGDRGGGRLKIWKAEIGSANGGGAVPGTIVAIDPRGIAVACGAGSVRLLEVQAEGGRRLPAGDFVRGSRLAEGDRLRPGLET